MVRGGRSRPTVRSDPLTHAHQTTSAWAFSGALSRSSEAWIIPWAASTSNVTHDTSTVAPADEEAGAGRRRAVHPQSGSVGKLRCTSPGSPFVSTRLSYRASHDAGRQGCPLPQGLAESCS